MKEIIEIRWHGRGGQGAKTAALLFADAALDEGKYVQAFPEYGPERMGAPVQSFNRLSDHPINVHCGVKSPQVVVVLDVTLLEALDPTEGLREDGILLLNTEKSPQEIRERLGLQGRRIFTVDASRISRETIGSDIPNTPMLGALIRATGLIDFEKTLENTRKRLEEKFRTKPDMINGNLQAIKRAYKEVRGE